MRRDQREWLVLTSAIWWLGAALCLAGLLTAALTSTPRVITLVGIAFMVFGLVMCWLAED